MEQLVEELYSRRRNAITIWQGYEYQGMMGLLRFLEKLVSEYEKRPGGPAELDLKLKFADDERHYVTLIRYAETGKSVMYNVQD